MSQTLTVQAMQRLEQYSNALAKAYGIPVNALAKQFSVTGPVETGLRAALLASVEFLGLINRRAQAYMQIPTRLAQCRSPQDVVNEQMTFWRTAGQQYAETSRKVFDAWTSAELLEPSNGRPAERDYINFNGTGSKESPAQTSRPEQPAGNKHRRVA